jgi:acetylornithine/N-succinyldiaminopimelate aminotransferase
MEEMMQKTNLKPALRINPPFPKSFASELLEVERGEGVWLVDAAGNRYLDFSGGIAVNALGYGREDLARVAADQMRKLIHVSNLFTTGPAVRLAEKMIRHGVGPGEGFAAVQYMNSGSEANEAALKFARLYALRRRGEGHYRLACFTGAFHGRTMGSLAVTPSAKYQDPFQPLVPGVEVLPYNDAGALERALDAGFAGAIVEVIQGEGGLASMTPEFAAALNRLCRRHDVILIADEVQTGLSRTGTFYACQGVGLEPDIVTLAKPLAAGLPLSAVLLPAKVNDLLHLGEHGTTFGGGPVTTAVAERVWDILADPAFVESVARRGARMRERLAGLAARFPFLGEVRGRGLLLGLEVVPQAAAEAGLGADPLKTLSDRMRERGLLVLRSGDRFLRLAPPLVISEEEIEEGMRVMAAVFQEYHH